MNIFAFDPDPKLSAMWLDDVRANKMILETAQLLSTAIRFSDPSTTLPIYKAAYVSHPCTRWVRSYLGNFAWLCEYMDALGKRKPNHKSLALLSSFRQHHSGPANPQPFTNCARNKSVGVDFSHVSDVCDAYRQYISARWQRDTIRLTWKTGVEPDWRL